jgi:DNA (cytosine-5)-methyltransferase 1
MRIASFFSGAGGLDEGFREAGFTTVWANEIDRTASKTFELNHGISVERRSITAIRSHEIPIVEGFIGGPPCQSWSAAGAKRGLSDPRGALFFDYVRMIGEVRPKFFVAENVQGLLSPRNSQTLDQILKNLADLGYDVSIGLLNAADFGIPQTRKRVFIVGFRSDLGATFSPPMPSQRRRTIKESLKGLAFDSALAVKSGQELNHADLEIPNQHYWDGSHFSYIYMSRNRRRDYDEQSFTIQASAAHAPLHPESAPMVRVGVDQFEFDTTENKKPRRMSVRECARMQTFPDSYQFIYESINDGYKQVGNAVPVALARLIAIQIREALKNVDLNINPDMTGKSGQITRF